MRTATNIVSAPFKKTPTPDNQGESPSADFATDTRTEKGTEADGVNTEVESSAPSYQLNGEEVTKGEVEQFINNATQEDIDNSELTINNDPILEKAAEDKVKSLKEVYESFDDLVEQSSAEFNVNKEDVTVKVKNTKGEEVQRTVKTSQIKEQIETENNKLRKLKDCIKS